MKNLIAILLSSIVFYSCTPQESSPTTSSLHVAAGDILVSSTVTDTVHQFDKKGNYIRPLWRTTLASEVIGGVSWAHETNEILIAINGTPDRVEAISVIDGSRRVLINDTNINGTITVAIQLVDSRDILISELTAIERANNLGGREIVTGVWPSTQTTNIRDLIALADGGFATASSSTGLRTFPDSMTAFTATNTVAAPAGTTGSYGIVELANGRFLASWEGAATDLVSLYESNLTHVEDVFTNNQSLLVAPRGVAVKANGNYLVADNTRDYVIEFDHDGDIVGYIGVGGTLDGADRVFVVPEFSP